MGNKLPPLALPETRKAVELFHSTEPQRAATWFEAEVEPDQKRAAQCLTTAEYLSLANWLADTPSAKTC